MEEKTMPENAQPINPNYKAPNTNLMLVLIIIALLVLAAILFLKKEGKTTNLLPKTKEATEETVTPPAQATSEPAQEATTTTTDTTGTTGTSAAIKAEIAGKVGDIDGLDLKGVGNSFNESDLDDVN